MDREAAPIRECDVIMKGGITSGVVYPRVILTLKDAFRFRSIGGTSAGAIAAAVTAAAEYGRAGGGFERLEDIAAALPEQLESLFQPEPSLSRLFGLAKSIPKRGMWGALAYLIAHYSGASIAALAALVLVSLVAIALATNLVLALLFSALVAIIIFVLVVLISLQKEIFLELKGSDFGLCPGRTIPADQGKQGLSDWLAEAIESVSGHSRFENGLRLPLTFGDLETPGGTQLPIRLRMMTTNLALGRPHCLPDLKDRNYYWSESDFRRILPGWVVDYLLVVCRRKPDTPAGVQPFPSWDTLPVVLATRMSLSFPILLSAVPLYRQDFPVADAPPLRKVLFSDGGLSSNFPIHFFDVALPSRPTFGISIEPYEEERPARRAYLPMPASSGLWLPILQLESLGGFLSAILSSAMNWQDRMQTGLSGYRERVARVYLKDGEGGLNLAMEPPLVESLVKLGGRAGALLLSQPIEGDKHSFDFDDHRWRRFLVAYAQIEQLLEEIAEAWGVRGDPASFATFIDGIKDAPRSYAGSDQTWRTKIADRMDALAAFQRARLTPPLRDEGDRPAFHGRMRIVPDP